MKNWSKIGECISNLVLSLSSNFRRILCPFASILFILSEFFARIRSWRACLLHARFSSPRNALAEFWGVTASNLRFHPELAEFSSFVTNGTHIHIHADTYTHPRNASLRGYFDFVINLPHQPETSILQGKLATPAASTCTIQFGSRILSW